MNMCSAYRVCLCYYCIGLHSSFYHFKYRFWCRELFRGWSLRQHGIRFRFRGVPRWVFRLDAVAFISFMFWERCETYDTVFMILSFEILDTHLFWAPACAYVTFENLWLHLPFIYDVLLSEAVFRKILSEKFWKLFSAV